MIQLAILKPFYSLPVLGILLVLVACAAPVHAPMQAVKSQGRDIEAVSILPLSKILPHLTKYRAVLVGEQHDRYDHHLAQLEVIKFLFEKNPKLAIGLEIIQQPFQAVLDDFSESTIDEQAMLIGTEYFKRWRYDYRLYAPIFRFARANSIPLIALNLPAEIVRQTARNGLASLNDEQKSQIPKFLQHDVAGYRERIEKSLADHGTEIEFDLESFIEAQLLWDEGMANRAADYLNKNPEKNMVILAGAGHVIERTGIPVRLERILKTPVAAVVNTRSLEEAYKGMGDFIIHTEKTELEDKGQIGIYMGFDEKGVKVSSFSQDSAAKEAGLQVDDYLRQINDQLISSFAEVSLTMWQKLPGDKVRLTVDRYSGESVNALEYDLTLR